MNTSSAAARPVSDEMQDAVERLRSTINTVASDPVAGNAEFFDMEPGLFRALARQRGGRDSIGTSWERPLPQHFGYRLAPVQRQVAGLNGLASLLLADFETQQEGEAHQQFTPFLREQLFMALTELAGAAYETMQGLSNELADTDYKARKAQGGGE